MLGQEVYRGNLDTNPDGTVSSRSENSVKNFIQSLFEPNDYGAYGNAYGNDVVEIKLITTFPQEEAYSFYVIFEIFFANLVTEDYKMQHNLLDPPPAPGAVKLFLVNLIFNIPNMRQVKILRKYPPGNSWD